MRMRSTIVFGVGVLVFNLATHAVQRGGLPSVENREDYTLAVLSYHADTEIDYDENEVEHSVEMGFRVTAPEGVDAVCVREFLVAVEAIDDEDDDILVIDRRRQNNEKQYVAFSEDEVEASLKTIQLSRPAFTLESLVLAAEVVVARDRDTFEMPAVVMDDARETGYDTAVRISEMKIGRDRTVDITIEYNRDTDDGAPLPEAVYALDDDGNILGGGRWEAGNNIFGGEGEFQAEFEVGNNADVATLRIVFLTDYDVVEMQFEITGVFQH